jgi:hypothetical protein
MCNSSLDTEGNQNEHPYGKKAVKHAEVKQFCVKEFAYP